MTQQVRSSLSFSAVDMLSSRTDGRSRSLYLQARSVSSAQHPMLTIRYSLVLDIEFPGIGNSIKVKSGVLDFMSALSSSGTEVNIPAFEDLPAYDDDESDDGDAKDTKEK